MDYKFEKTEIELIESCIKDYKNRATGQSQLKLNSIELKISEILADVKSKEKDGAVVHPVLYLMIYSNKDKEIDKLKAVLTIKDIITNHLHIIDNIDFILTRLAELEDALKKEIKNPEGKKLFKIKIDLSNLVLYSSALVQVNHRRLEHILNYFWEEKGGGE